MCLRFTYFKENEEEKEGAEEEGESESQAESMLSMDCNVELALKTRRS